jgi:hypothetical protein
VLHPQHKLSYFKQAGWPTEWIHTAEEIVRAEFKCSYATDVDVDEEGGEVGNNGDGVILVHIFAYLISYSSHVTCSRCCRSQKIYSTISLPLPHLGNLSSATS